MTFEVRVDCPSCRVEGARVETWDGDEASCRLGVPSVTSCQLCGHEAVGQVARRPSPSGEVDGRPWYVGEGCPGCGVPIDERMREARGCVFCGATATLADRAAPQRFASLADLERALEAWARREALATPQDLVDAYFVLRDPTEIFAALSRGEAIETTFDVADYLFSSGASAGGATAEPAVLRLDDAPPVTLRMKQPTSIRPTGGPRDELYALVSVAAADGEASADDRAILARGAERRGVPPLEDADVRVWRPNEVSAPPTLVDRERVIEEMFQVACVDGQLDESELRVIREFARAWGVDPERLREWMELYSFGDANWVERWMRRVGLFLFPAG